MESYFNVIKQTLAVKKLYEDVGFDIDTVHHKMDAFKVTIIGILNAPPPKQEAPPKAPTEE
jgi:hypothetical protein